MPAVFERSVWVPARVEEVFAFHLDPENIRLISPPGLRVLEVEKAPKSEVGAVMRLRVRQLGWTQLWEVRWEVMEPPAGEPAVGRLVDQALRSPFAFWRHEHRFQADGCGCFLTDRVEYALPWRPWSRAAEPVVGWILARMFTERHRRTVAHWARESAGRPGRC